jgi:hypothetical protein
LVRDEANCDGVVHPIETLIMLIAL